MHKAAASIIIPIQGLKKPEMDADNQNGILSGFSFAGQMLQYMDIIKVMILPALSILNRLRKAEVSGRKSASN